MKSTDLAFSHLNYASLLMLVLTFGVATTSTGQPHQQEMQWQPFEEAIEKAQNSRQLILVDVWAPWCGWCQKMKQETYPNLSADLRSKIIFTRLNRDDHTSNLQYQGRSFTPMKLAKSLNAQNVPTIVLLDSEGQYLAHIPGFIKPAQLSKILRDILNLSSDNESQVSIKSAGVSN